MLNKKGQSTLEYVILFAAVVIVFVAYLRPGGTFTQKMTQSLDDTTDTMTDVSRRVKKAFSGGN